LFSIVTLKTLDISQGSVVTHLRCGGIFSDSIIIHFDSEIILKIDRLIFHEVKAYQKTAILFGPPCRSIFNHCDIVGLPSY